MLKTITQKQLHELFYYDPEIGIFTYKKSPNFRINIGDIAGSIHHQGYIQIISQKIHYQAHRLAWLYVYGEHPDGDIDHINHIRNDNRISNLRVVTKSINNKNAKLRHDNKSGQTGVYYCNGKWRCSIRVNKTLIHIGMFIDKSTAIIARKNAEKKYGFHENHGKKHNVDEYERIKKSAGIEKETT